MTLPTAPRAWAAHLTRMLRAVVPEANRFPVNVRGLALDYSQQVFPAEPIRHVEGASLEGCDGALVRIRGSQPGWGVVYNDTIPSSGRINFTLAHEFGHYLVHRQAFPDGLRCSQDDIAAGAPGIRDIEREADQFASDLLMPFDDFRMQIAAKEAPDLDALSACAHRYGVSLMAATLRWLNYTERRALLAVSRDGFLLWARSSDAARKTGAFFRTANGPPIEIPGQSLVATGAAHDEQRAGIDHAPGVWLPEPCREFSVTSERYDFGLSLLLFGDAPERRWGRDDDDGDSVAIPVDRAWR